MKKWNKKKRILALVALLLAAAIGAGVIFLAPGGGEPVGVYPFMNVGMTEFWGDSQESHGPVSTDKIQTVFLTETQTITGILVKAGDTVKKGDVLMTFDTTLSGLSLERKRLEVEKQKLQVEIAQQELREINKMKPMEIPNYEIVIPEPFLGEERKEPYEIFRIEGNDGKSQEQAVICWLREDVQITDVLLEEIRRKVWNNAGVCEHGLLTEDCEVCNPPICKHERIAKDCEICNVAVCEHGLIKALCEICTPIMCRHNQVEKNCALCNAERCTHDNLKNQCNICNPKCRHGNSPNQCQACPCDHALVRKDCLVCNPPPPPVTPEPTTGQEPTSPTPAAEPPQEPMPAPAAETGAEPLGTFGNVSYRVQLLSSPGDSQPAPADNACYVVFKTTEGNYQLGSLTTWQGVKLTGKGTDFTLHLFSPMIADYSVPDIAPAEPQPTIPEFDIGSGYTLVQIAQMRREQEKKIKDLEFDLKMKETEYKIMQTELEDGNVYSEIDGEVISVLTEEEAKQNRQPIVKVSGGGGFLVEGSVSELEKDKMELGQEVTINDWNTGMTYTGTIQAMGDFPDSNGYWNGMGNPNTTYYPFTVFVDGSADLQAGSYVSMTYSSSSGEHGVYLENPFIRTEQGKSYVYVLGAGGKLEKREVVTGRSLWGSYTEVLSGLSETDLIAFPYGKNVKHGAPAQEKEISELYS